MFHVCGVTVKMKDSTARDGPKQSDTQRIFNSHTCWMYAPRNDYNTGRCVHPTCRASLCMTLLGTVNYSYYLITVIVTAYTQESQHCITYNWS